MEEIKSAESRSRLPFTQHHAFIIGIDEYQHISPLQTAVNDARKLEDVLKSQQHFSVHTPLLNATGKAIRDLLQKTLKETVTEKDRVVFYFAGHGIAEDGEKGPAGYIVPADADPNDVRTFIPMEDLQNALNNLPCRHLLLILDCCFSGAFKWSSQFRAFGSLMPKRIYKERFDRFVEDTAWQVITSSAYDQKAMDVLQNKHQTGVRGSITVNDDTMHSPFAAALFRGLAGEADTKVGQFGDGVITATELYSYIRDQIEPATIQEAQALRQTPGLFPLRNDNKGEFIFLHPRHPLNLPPTPNRSPFKGLESFSEDDKELFYGRESVIAELYEKATSNKLLVVSGASGSGKSSVVQAGLLPVLRENGFHILSVVRPGVAPMASLEKALHGETIAGKKAVLIIDQYEELFTRCNDQEERRTFVARLRAMLDGVPPNMLTIILTVRSDFESFLTEGELKGNWAADKYSIPPLTVEDLKEAIVGPTLQEVLIFDPQDLVDDLVQDVVQSPGGLPLLSHTLSELYKVSLTSGRQDRALKREDYDKVGGVIGALLAKADALYQTLDTGAQNTMRKIMLRMVLLDGELASRRVPVDELRYADPAENKRVQLVVDTLVDARLIVKDKDYIEPAHAALVQKWKTLLDWLHTIGEDKILLNSKLNSAASEFDQSKNIRFLWNNNPHLGALQQELTNPQQWFNNKEIHFIQQSVQRKKTIRRILQAITAGVMFTLTALTVWALISRYEATQNFKKAKSNLLAIRSSALLKSDPTQAVRVAQAAYEILEPQLPAAATQVLSMAFHSRAKAPFYAACFRHSNHVNSAVFSSDGHFVLTASEDGFARLWNARGDSLRSFDHGGYEVLSALFSTDGKSVTTFANSTVRRWATSGELIDSLPRTPGELLIEGRRILVSQDKKQRLTVSEHRIATLHDEEAGFSKSIASNVVSADFSHDGKQFLTVSLVGDSLSVIRLWNKQGSLLFEFEYKDWVTSAVFSPDGSSILTASKDHTAKLWDLSQRFVHRLSHNSRAVNTTFFSGDGLWVLTASQDGVVRLWDVRGVLVDSLQHESAVTSAYFSPDAKRILTVSEDGANSLWFRDEQRMVKRLQGVGVKTSMFSSDGSLIVSASSDSTAKLWTANGEPLRTLRHQQELLRAIFSPSGKQILTVSSESLATLWDVEGKVLKTFKHRGEIRAAIFVQGDKYILTGSADSTAILWETESTADPHTFKHGDEVNVIACSPDGRKILTGNRIVKLWNTKGLLLDSMAHLEAVTSAAFSPNGELILTASVDKSAKLWNLKGEVLANYDQHTLKVNSAVFSGDGKRILTASDDGFVIMWWSPVAIHEWLKTAPVHKLTSQEMRLYDITN